MKNLNTFFFVVSAVVFLLSVGNAPVFYFAVGFSMAWVLYWLGTMWPSFFLRQRPADPYDQDIVAVANTLRTRFDSPIWVTADGELIPLCKVEDGHLINIELFLCRVLAMGKSHKTVLVGQVETTDPNQWLAMVRGEMAHRNVLPPGRASV